MKKKFFSLQVCAYAMVGIVSASGCSKNAEDSPPASRELPRCQKLLGEKNVRSAIDAMGEGELLVTARHTGKDLAGLLALEAKAWEKDDLLHNSYSACRLSVLREQEEGVKVVEATVKWSALLLDFMSKPKYAETWRKVNDQVFVETRGSSSDTRLLIACRVPGAAAGQVREMPLEVAVGDPGFDAALRGKLLTMYARVLTDGLGCTNAPQIPRTLPE
jgi:hypothetical protein